MDLPAEQIGLYYRYRWHIELFFRWFKCILGCTHLLSHSKNGIQIQVYCALIASLLIRIWTGRKPTKRTFETICLYLSGWVTSEELEEHISTLQLNKKSQTAKSKWSKRREVFVLVWDGGWSLFISALERISKLPFLFSTLLYNIVKEQMQKINFLRHITCFGWSFVACRQGSNIVPNSIGTVPNPSIINLTSVSSFGKV